MLQIAIQGGMLLLLMLAWELAHVESPRPATVIQVAAITTPVQTTVASAMLTPSRSSLRSARLPASH